MAGDQNLASGNTYWGSNLTAAVLNGTIPQWRLDDMVVRIMSVSLHRLRPATYHGSKILMEIVLMILGVLQSRPRYCQSTGQLQFMVIGYFRIHPPGGKRGLPANQ